MTDYRLRFDTPLRFLKGVGPRRAESLAGQGLESVEDLLYVLPFRYEDRRSFARIADLRAAGPETTLDVTVVSSRIIPTRRRGFSVFEAHLEDRSGRVRAVWYNQPFLERLFVEGRRAVVFGRPTEDRYGSGLVLENPDYEFLDDADAEGVHTGRIVPVYRKLGELSSRMQRTLLHRALSEVDPQSFPRTVPVGIVRRVGLLDRLDALRQIHFPSPDSSLEALHERRTATQRSLAFEEIFLLQLALAMRRHAVRTAIGCQPMHHVSVLKTKYAS